MLNFINKIYRFLPVQLLLLHFRKYQLLLFFWVLLIATLSGNFAAHFGASTLFLAPEYLGEINFVSMFFLGSTMAIFIMSWNITTFIIHSHRVPFLGATRHAFLKYCINNAIIPLAFLIFYSVISIRFQYVDEHASIFGTILMQLGFYSGLVLFLFFSFAYFFRVDRDLFKAVLSTITNPSVIRGIIPYDSLDVEFDMIRANTFLSETLHLERTGDLENYHPRLLSAVLRRHHRNAITATIFALLLLFVLGAFSEHPRLRIPAGGSFLLLFTVMTGLVGAMKYFLKTWELMGWVFIVLLLSIMVHWKIFDLRSIAYGLDYKTKQLPVTSYEYDSVKHFFNEARYVQDEQKGLDRLNQWRTKLSTETKPPLVIISVSGGGTRAAYWTFAALQRLDSLCKGKIFSNTVLMTGASGGMIGAAYWRSIHMAAMQGKISNPYNSRYQANIGKDLLNAIIFSFACVDIISPFNKISVSGRIYTKDRGYSMEEELIRNTEGVLDAKLGDFQKPEAEGTIPQMIINGTIIDDGRRLMMSAQPIAFLTQPAYALRDTANPPIDAIDFASFFAHQQPFNLRLSTALRMNATFPYILPVVKMPCKPQMNIMDAGLRDNFGTEVALRYFFVFRKWMAENVGNIIFLQIRDTRENEVLPSTEESSLGAMLIDPLTVIENKWEPFQSYAQGYIKDMTPELSNRVHFITLSYFPKEIKKSAALNFHLTSREKQDLLQSLYNPTNEAAIKTTLELLQ